jgi:hypothetical protein
VTYETLRAAIVAPLRLHAAVGAAGYHHVSRYRQLLGPTAALHRESAVGALITFLAGWVLVLLKSKLGLSIDDSIRASIQTAATNAAGLVLNKLGNTLNGKTVDVGKSWSLTGWRRRAPASFADETDARCLELITGN